MNKLKMHKRSSIASLRGAVLPAVLSALLGLSSAVAARKPGDVYITANTTLSKLTPRNVYIGYANAGDHKHKVRAASPTVSIVQGADVHGRIYVYNGSAVHLTGGESVGYVDDPDGSRHPTVALESDFVIGCDHSTVTMEGGSFLLWAAGTSLVTLRGGRADVVYGSDNSTLNVLGGVMHQVAAFRHGTVNLRGGKISSEIDVHDSATLNLFGSRLRRTPIPKESDEGRRYKLSGSLSDGTSLDNTTLVVFSGKAKVNLINTPPLPASNQTRVTSTP